MSKRKYVDVNVSWCYGDCSPTAKVPLKSWEAILQGEKVSADASYWYEGERFFADFQFNHAGPGTLLVTYDDGGVGFDGNIEDAQIVGGHYPARLGNDKNR